MYLTTVGTTDALTLNAPYPCCHENVNPCSCAHRDEFALIVATALARVKVAGICTKKCA